MSLEEKETEKVIMKESELQQFIEDKTKKALEKFAEKEVGEKIDILLTEQKEAFGAYAKDELKEQFQDLLSKYKIDPALEEAEKKGTKFKSFGDFLTSIRKFRVNRDLDDRLAFIDKDGRLEKTAGHMEIGEDSQGGFLVPEVYRDDLQIIALENAIVRPNGPTIIPSIRTDSVKIPYINDISHATTVFGGVQAQWVAEAALKPSTKLTFGQMELVPKKLAGLTYTSNELLMDSAIALEPFIKKAFGTAWGYYEDLAFLNGTGVGQPLGILNCPCLKVVNRNTLMRVMLEDIAEMYACMLDASRDYAIWVINPSVIPELLEMGSGNAADASGKILVFTKNVQGKPEWQIWGRPVFFSEKVPGLGTQGDIGFFDMRYYFIFDRQPITIDVSTHVAFTTDETCWRFVLRVAGQCWPPVALTPRNAAAPVTSISPFVVLGTATS